MLPNRVGALYKFGDPTPEDHAWVFGHTWAIEDVGGGQRLMIAPAANQVGILARLTEIMQDPMWLLYVLVVPRGGTEAGRYQSSQPQSREQLRVFLRDFGLFFETDGRHNLWIRSVGDGSMLVYDRHNLIYAYGHLEEWKLVLRHMGMIQAGPRDLYVPVPHSHHYHESFDNEEHRLLSYLPWRRSPLHEQDER
ncbi:MAG: hypothetical protein JOZ62_19465 [Acidobacteriaceae bacterium]|nr:hypothetical protein [Acidobacteriaceae bacterium]